MRITVNRLLVVVAIQLAWIAWPTAARADELGLGSCSTCESKIHITGPYHYFIDDCCDPSFGAERCFNSQLRHVGFENSKGGWCGQQHDACPFGGGGEM